MNKDKALEKKAENARELGLDYEPLEAKDEPYALEASMFSNDRMKVDPVTGNVSIGTPQRTWVGLTDAEVDQAFTELTLRKIYQAIEAKLRRKNYE
jgi:hypothetical protein